MFFFFFWSTTTMYFSSFIHSFISYSFFFLFSSISCYLCSPTSFVTCITICACICWPPETNAYHRRHQWILNSNVSGIFFIERALWVCVYISFSFSYSHSFFEILAGSMCMTVFGYTLWIHSNAVISFLWWAFLRSLAPSLYSSSQPLGAGVTACVHIFSLSLCFV